MHPTGTYQPGFTPPKCAFQNCVLVLTTLSCLAPPCPLPAVCPKGTFENGTSCNRCPTNSYCPGGDKAENPTSRGEAVTCGAGLVTRNTGARTVSDCLAPAGAAMTSPGVATNCSMSQYAPMFNRLTKCLRCQGGLEENPALNLTGAQRATKRAVCSEWLGSNWPSSSSQESLMVCLHGHKSKGPSEGPDYI
jgi:hypothetical protein